MCTVTWIRRVGGFELYSNRDERRTRPPSLPPERRRGASGVEYAAPIDAEAGGSWIAVNERGLALCLLNHYQAAEPDADPGAVLSRGSIVTDLADAASVAEVRGRIDALDLARLRGFRLLALSPGEAEWGYAWDGRLAVELEGEQLRSPLVSSGYDLPGVERSRRALYARLREPSADALRAFHASHDPERGPYSVCMHRDDAETQSFTAVVVEPGRARLVHRPGAPCLGRPEQSVELALEPAVR